MNVQPRVVLRAKRKRMRPAKFDAQKIAEVETDRHYFPTSARAMREPTGLADFKRKTGTPLMSLLRLQQSFQHTPSATSFALQANLISSTKSMVATPEWLHGKMDAKKPTLVLFPLTARQMDLYYFQGVLRQVHPNWRARSIITFTNTPDNTGYVRMQLKKIGVKEPQVLAIDSVDGNRTWDLLQKAFVEEGRGNQFLGVREPRLSFQKPFYSTKKRLNEVERNGTKVNLPYTLSEGGSLRFAYENLRTFNSKYKPPYGNPENSWGEFYVGTQLDTLKRYGLLDQMGIIEKRRDGDRYLVDFHGKEITAHQALELAFKLIPKEQIMRLANRLDEAETRYKRAVYLLGVAVGKEILKQEKTQIK